MLSQESSPSCECATYIFPYPVYLDFLVSADKVGAHIICTYLIHGAADFSAATSFKSFRLPQKNVARNTFTNPREDVQILIGRL